jgi:hypothetical protein
MSSHTPYSPIMIVMAKSFSAMILMAKEISRAMMAHKSSPLEKYFD